MADSYVTRPFHRDELHRLNVTRSHIKPGQDNPNGWAVIHSREWAGESRWTVQWDVVFQVPGEDTLYQVTYEEGATEVQEDQDPWNDEETIDAYVVTPVPVTVIKYRKTRATT